jgi:basic membrane protein A and related proteins
MRLRRIAGVVAAAAAALALTSCSATSTTTSTAQPASAAPGALKVAFVYIGSPADGGWTAKHAAGAKELKATLGDKVAVTEVENIKDDATSKPTFQRLAREGNKLIFATSFGFGDPMLEVAKEFPDVKFEWATGYKTATNLGTYFGAAEEARYLTGMAAASLSKTGKLGYVAAFPIPEVVRGLDAFTLGVRAVKPAATVEVTWTSTWFDPTKEGQAADALLAKGIDVLGMHQDSTAVGQAAQKKGARWVGYNADASAAAPKAWISAPTWDWGPYYTKAAQSVIDGTWRAQQYYGSMADGLVGYAPLAADVPADVKAKIEKTAADIKAGSFKPFTGPIKDNTGAEKIPAGTSADLPALLKLDYAVEGVIGTIPKS